jgi:hypothetical protein
MDRFRKGSEGLPKFRKPLEAFRMKCRSSSSSPVMPNISAAIDRRNYERPPGAATFLNRLAGEPARVRARPSGDETQFFPYAARPEAQSPVIE